MTFYMTAPLFALIAMGYLAVRLKFITKDANVGLGRFALYFGVPAIIFRALSQSDFTNVLNSHFILAYAGGGLMSFIIIFFISKYLTKATLTESGLNAFGSALPNSIIIGAPLLIQIYGSLPSGAFTMALLVENILIFPLALILMDLGIHKDSSSSIISSLRTILTGLPKNQFLMAIVLGLCVSAFQIPIPDVLGKIIDLMGQAAPAVSLFFIGGTLVGSTLNGRLGTISLVACGKLMIHPLLVAFIITLLPEMDTQLRVSAIVFASCPMLTIYPIVASKYALAQEATSTLLLTTIASFLTLTVSLWLVL